MKVIFPLLFSGVVLIVGAECKAEPGLAIYLDGNSLRQMLTDSDVVSISMARGYVAGIADATNGKTHCIYGNVPASQAAAIAHKFLENHPEWWQHRATDLIERALTEAFPCKAVPK
ncbi:MAG: Rap1a/Tai family immunity protein [Hydrogenophilaceae bacterium]